MNILICKIGQKVYFNRSSDEAKRNNSNGNYGTYVLMTLLFDKNPNDTFYVVSESDVNAFWEYPNVINASSDRCDCFDKNMCDVIIVFAGMVDRQDDNGRLADLINHYGKKYILIADDPRCLDSVARSSSFVRTPDVILSGTDKWFDWYCGPYKIKVHAKYAPIEKAMCYDNKYGRLSNVTTKDIDLLVVANSSLVDSEDSYDRLSIISNMVSGVSGVKLYGKLTDDEISLFGSNVYKGQVEFDYMQNIMTHALTTLIVPIRVGWVTAKYVEALLAGAFPIFHRDYGTYALANELAGSKVARNIPIVKTRDELNSLLWWVKNNERKAYKIKQTLYEKLVLPYQDGVAVNNSVMQHVKGC